MNKIMWLWALQDKYVNYFIVTLRSLLTRSICVLQACKVCPIRTHQTLWYPCAVCTPSVEKKM
jgi:hypothetical protein